MASDLSPVEKEEKEAERLLNKKPPPSRKKTERRAPKRDNRRIRTKVDDPDIKSPVEGDKDLSLNFKTQGSIFRQIAIRLVSKSKKTKPKSKKPQTEKKPQPEAKPKSDQAKYDTLKQKAINTIDKISPYFGKPFVNYLNKIDGKPDRVTILQNFLNELPGKTGKILNELKNSNNKKIVSVITSLWPEDPSDFLTRAAILGGVVKAIEDHPLPDSFKIPFKRGDISVVVSDKDLLRELIESSVDKKGNFKNFDDGQVLSFAQLVTIFKKLKFNPGTISSVDLNKNIDELANVIEGQLSEIYDLESIMETWHGTMIKYGDTKTSYGKNNKQFLHDVDEFMKDTEYVDPTVIVQELEEYANDNYDYIPQELKDIFEVYSKSSNNKAASNEKIQFRDMPHKVATYHGIIDQGGHPTDSTNTPWLHTDKRYFNEASWKSIVKFAKELLNDDWFKHGWDAGATDAPLRAALDTAIHISGDSVFQSKIDTETYNMLLNRLANWDYDTFSDTVLPMKAPKARSASMKQEYNEIVRIANSIRKDQPTLAFGILKNLRGLVAANETKDEPEETTAGDLGKPEDLEIGEDDIESFMKNFDSALDKSKIKDDKVRKEFYDIISEALAEVVKGQKTASVRVPLGILVRIANTHPETRSVLLPIIAKKKAPPVKTKGKNKVDPKSKPKAKKSEDIEIMTGKSKAKKTSNKGKKAPQKKKASLTTADLDW